MNPMRTAVLVTVAGVALAGVVFGFQSGGRGGGERAAGTWVRLGEKEQIGITYNTLRLGAKTLEGLKTNERMRGMWAQRLPALLEATLKNDVELAFGETKVPAGSHGLSFAMTADGTGWELHLLDGEKTTATIPLKAEQSPSEYGFMNINIVSTGADTVKLACGYGTITASAEAKIATAEK